jgi:hypothetical protein
MIKKIIRAITTRPMIRPMLPPTEDVREIVAHRGHYESVIRR